MSEIDAVERALDLEAIAHEIKSAQDDHRQIRTFTERFSGFDGAAAYEVARLIHEARVAEGASAVGRKIGFTNRGMWPVFNVCEPIWAYLCGTFVVHLSPGYVPRRTG